MGNSYELTNQKAQKTGRYDSRSINRGDVPGEIMSGQMSSVQKEVFEGTMSLIAARMNLGDLMRRGDLTIIENSNPKVLTFMRSHGQQKLLVIKNVSDSPTEISLDGNLLSNGLKFVEDVLSNQRIETSSGKIILKLLPDETLWLVPS